MAAGILEGAVLLASYLPARHGSNCCFLPRLPLESAPPGVRHYADDRLPCGATLGRVIEGHAPAERFFAGKYGTGWRRPSSGGTMKGP
ncbi:MAG: hypothetical protein ACREAA_16535 [Candidatus Polarisedimenticolia bacterium]